MYKENMFLVQNNEYLIPSTGTFSIFILFIILRSCSLGSHSINRLSDDKRNRKICVHIYKNNLLTSIIDLQKLCYINKKYK